MAMLEKYDLTKNVVFKNEILKSDYYTQPDLSLTLNQKKIILYLVSKIEKNDDRLKMQEIDLKEYCSLFNISFNGGNDKRLLFESLNELGRKCFFVPQNREGTIDRQCRWVDEIIIDYKKNTIKIKLSDKLKRFYLDLNEQYTQFQLGYIMNFKSKYSLTAYENMKRIQNMGKAEIPIDEIRTSWTNGKYPRFYDIKKNVLEPAKAEINEKTDIFMDYEIVKDGRAVKSIIFHVDKKRNYEKGNIDEWKREEQEKEDFTPEYQKGRTEGLTSSGPSFDVELAEKMAKKHMTNFGSKKNKRHKKEN